MHYSFFNKEHKGLTHCYLEPKYIDVKISADEAKANRKYIGKQMQSNGLVIMRQIHSSLVEYVDSAPDYGDEPECDAIITDIKGLALAAQASDCVPVLLYAKDKELIAAVHAGWKGAKLGVINNVIREMHNRGAKDIGAIICPSIQQKSYEVDNKFYDDFISEDQGSKDFFILGDKKHDKQHYFFDLPGFVKHHLTKEGIEEIIDKSEDTYENHHIYLSHRYHTHQGGIRRGNNLFVIMLAK